MKLIKNLPATIVQELSIKRASSSKAIHIVGIDGPTASGKTILANHVAESFKAGGVDTWVYRLDWALLDRAQRVADLAVIKQSDAPFAYEGELHMRLGIVEQFFRKVASYNQRFSDLGADLAAESVSLTDLYSRENGGDTSGTDTVLLKPGLVIIIEGHYTLRTALHNLIDLNCVLVGDAEEFLKRKVARVSGYRGAEEATDYFWRVDVPSFKYHLTRFGINADLLIDNTDYLNPKLIDQLNGNSWLLQENTSGKDVASVSDFLFSKSSLVKNELRQSIETAVKAIRKWDDAVGQHLRISIGELTSDLESLADSVTSSYNKELNGYKLEVSYTDALYEVYHRRLPVSIGIGIRNLTTGLLEASVLADINHQNLFLNLFWDGGHQQLSLKRSLGEIDASKTSVFKDSTPVIGQIFENVVRVLQPTSFTSPAFLRNVSTSPVFVGKESENISATKALLSLLSDGGVWIQRFSLFKEISFFQFALSACGISSMKAGNYLIAVRHHDKSLLQKFKSFQESWQQPFDHADVFNRAHDAYDKLVIDERNDARAFVEKNCIHFRMRDGYLFTPFLSGDGAKTKEALSELTILLSCPIRILRKRATQFIQQYLPNFTVPSNLLWSDLPEKAEEKISLNTLNSMGPSILSEVYLWLALREEPSAVLGANIYDIRENSLDCAAHIAAAGKSRKPIVLQSSLNAIGHRTSETYGYLEPKVGAEDLIVACKKAARNYVLLKKEAAPLYGIGLDHVNSENDRPSGRAKKFLNEAIATGELTHAVLDGSALFKARSTERKDLETAYGKVAAYAASLIDNPKDTYLLDREICAGELSYFGDGQQVHYPTASDLRIFVRALQAEFQKKKLDALLARPMLFIGNLGTTHHGEDKDIPKVEISQKWRDGLKSENFVSPVLHGTTKSHRDVLARATAGCHKINVAGDLLEVMFKNLPESVYQRSKSLGLEPKKTVAALRPEFDAFTAEESERIQQALFQKTLDLTETINSPVMSPMDENYFRYADYKYSNEHIQVIVQEVGNWLKAHSTQAKSKVSDSRVKHEFSASMIEVSLENMQGELLDTLWNKGIRYFHIDAGDGQFITRQFSGVEKAKIIRQKFPQALLHAHLMVKSPQESVDGEPSPIEQYINAGCNAVAIHKRSLGNPKEIVSVLKLIRRLGARPGLIIETSDLIDTTLKQIIKDANLDWSVVMGVPIGYGGQIFQFNTLSRISALHEFSIELGRDFLIECDGGLTFETARLCKNAGAQIFAGWSIVKAAALPEIEKKIDGLHHILRDATSL